MTGLQETKARHEENRKQLYDSQHSKGLDPDEKARQDRLNKKVNPSDWVKKLILAAQQEKFNMKDKSSGEDDNTTLDIIVNNYPIGETDQDKLILSEGLHQALHEAIKHQKAKSVQFLLDNNISPNIAFKKTLPIKTSILVNNLDIFKLLIAKGANLLQTDERKETILHAIAQITGDINPGILSVILQSKININAVNKYGSTVTHYAAASDKVLLLESLKTHNDFKLDIFDNDGRTPCHTAIINNQEKVVNWCLQNNMDINLITKKQETPLILASFYKHKNLVALFLKKDADPLLQDINGNNAYDYALKSNQTEIITLLDNKIKNLEEKKVKIEKKIDSENENTVEKHELNFIKNYISDKLFKREDLDSKNDQGSTALHLASIKGFINAIGQLISYNVSINIQDFYGNTPIHAAILGENYLKENVTISTDYTNSIKSVKYLIALSPDLYITNHKGHSPFVSAIIYSNKEAIKEILSFEPQIIHHKGLLNASMIHFATFYAKTDILQILHKDYGFLLNEKDENGMMAIDYANFLLKDKNLDFLKQEKLKVILEYFYKNECTCYSSIEHLQLENPYQINISEEIF